MSVCKNVSSAHSEWSKMSVRVQDEGGKEGEALGCQQTPIMPRGKRMCWSIYKVYTHASLCRFPTLLHPVFSSSLSFLFLGNSPPLVVDSIRCMLALPGTFRVHDKGMQSADPKGAYYNGRCSTARVCKGDAHFTVSWYSNEDLWGVLWK